jgi:hypothetical protein
MNFETWRAGLLAGRTLSELVAEFVEDGDGATVVSTSIMETWPVLDDVTAECSVLQVCCDFYLKWVGEWMQIIPGHPYVSPPLLLINDVLSSQDMLPNILITISKDASCYDPRICVLSSPEPVASDVLATAARLSKLLSLKDNKGWLFISETILTRMTKDFNSDFMNSTHSSKVNLLVSILVNLSVCGSEYYNLDRTDGGIIDSRLASINEMIVIVSRQLANMQIGFGNYLSDAEFISDLLAAARLGKCEYQLLCAIGFSLWST